MSSEGMKRYSPAGRIMETLASLGTRKPLRKMQAFGEGRERISVRQLYSMLHDAGNDLADYAFTLRKDFDAIVAERNALSAELAALKAANTDLQLHFDTMRAELDAIRKQQPAYWQVRFGGDEHSRYGLGEWQTIKPTGAYVGQTVETMLAEYRAYISWGQQYELRPLYAAPPAAAMDGGMVEELHKQHDLAWDTAGTILEKLSKANVEVDRLEAALEQYADDGNWCYDTCNISRDVAKEALAAHRQASQQEGE